MRSRHSLSCHEILNVKGARFRIMMDYGRWSVLAYLVRGRVSKPREAIYPRITRNPEKK